MRVRLAITAIAASILFGCHFKPAPPPIPECPTADECASIPQIFETSCMTDEDDRSYGFEARNRSTIYDVRINYLEKVKHLNTTLPDESISKVIEVAKNSSEFIGCKITKGFTSEVFDKWSYSIIDACFIGVDCDSTQDKFKPIPPDLNRPENLSCDAACAAGDKWCVKDSISTSSSNLAEKRIAYEMQLFAESLVNNSTNFSHDLKPLSDAINAFSGGSCKRGRYYVDDGEFESAGSQCDLYIEPSQSMIDFAGFHLPGLISGKHTTSPEQFDISFRDSVSGSKPFISIYTSENPNGVLIPINIFYGRKISGSKSNLIFDTQDSYCLSIDVQGGG